LNKSYLSFYTLLNPSRHHREMQDVVSEPTNKYPDVFVRNLAQKHMEDKQVRLKSTITSNISF
jgi:hypothetical protein